MTEQPSPSSGSTATLPEVEHARPTGKRLGVIMALYLFGIFMGAIDTGIVTPARTVIQNDLGVSEQAGIWLITIYTLGYAASIPVMGKLADRMGRKRIYLTSIALFGFGSILCGLSQDVGSFEMLIVARAIQAIGGGGILPVATAEFGTEVPPEKRGMALGMVGGVYGIANVFGASAGSAILDLVGTHNWQWIFYINVPIALGIVGVGLFALPNNRSDERKPIDGLGIMLLVAMILSLLYGLRSIDFFDLGNSLTSTEVYPYLLGFVVLLPLFILVERRAADPVMNLGYFSDRGIALTLILSMLTGFIMMGIVFVPQLAENAVRMPSGSGGYFVIIMGLASGVGAPLSGKLSDSIGPTKVLTMGAAISALAAAVTVLWLIPAPGMASVVVVLILMGLGLGFLIGAPLNYMMLQRTPKAESNSALATLSLVRALGTTVAPAIMVGFLAHAGAGMQDRLMAVLPTTIKAPVLPYQAELTATLKEFKDDPNFTEQLDGVALPDLDTPESIEIDPAGGTAAGEALPDHLVEALRTADVTNITERTKLVADYMFERETPGRVAQIQDGVQSGLDGMNDGLPKLTEASDDMRSALTEMGGKLSDMETALNRMDTGRSELDRGISGLDRGITGMTNGVAGLTRAVAGMDQGLTQQRAALATAERMMAQGGPTRPGGTPPPGIPMPTDVPTAIPTTIPRVGAVAYYAPVHRDRDGQAQDDGSASAPAPEATAAAVTTEPGDVTQAREVTDAQTSPERPTATGDGSEQTATAAATTSTPTSTATGPTDAPTSEPTSDTTTRPTGAPTTAPTSAPTGAPTSMPTGDPSSMPTGAPSGPPPGMPTARPGGMPGGNPQARLAGLRAAIAQTQAKRDAAAAQLATLRGKLSETRAARAQMNTARAELTTARANLATGHAELSKARKELADGRLEVEAAKTKLQDTITKMTALKAAVPGAFVQSRDEYMAEIDAQAPELERTFQEGINGGFRDLYLLYGASCLLTLSLLPLVPKPPRNDGEGDDEDMPDTD
ncbi:MAG: MFS transporter [Dermatophilus congolensis]|nr:MFS transporter [Dermatophilus congolensis]